MDQRGFRATLQTHDMTEEQIEQSVDIADRFEAIINGTGKTATPPRLPGHFPGCSSRKGATPWITILP